MKADKLITIAIPVYNMEKSVVNAINSAINQTYKETEILIVNDGSTDGSLDAIKSIHDSRLRIYNRKQNGGVCAAMRDLVDKAKGEYICFLDADDTMMPTRVEKQYNAIKAAEKLYTNRMIASFCGSVVQDIAKHKTYKIDPHDLFLGKFGGGTGHSMYKTQDLKNLGNFDTQFSRSADAAMCVNFLIHNGFYAMVEEPLITYNFIWNKSKKHVAKQESCIFKQIQAALFSDNPRNLYLRRFAGLPCYDDPATHIHIDLFGIKGLRLLCIRNKENGVKKLVRLFGFIPLLRIKNERK